MSSSDFPSDPEANKSLVSGDIFWYHSAVAA